MALPNTQYCATEIRHTEIDVRVRYSACLAIVTEAVNSTLAKFQHSMCSKLFGVPANKQTQELPSPFEKNILDSLWLACLAEAAVLFVVPTQYSMEHLRQLCASALPTLTRIGIPKFLKEKLLLNTRIMQQVICPQPKYSKFVTKYKLYRKI